MAQLDTSVFDKLHTFEDYQKADQAFQIQKALQTQQLQTGNIDAASKANVYKTQLLSGAAAGGQGAYDQARQTLQGQGIDTSEYAPDVNTASQQLQAARLAQSPLGSLLNAGTKMTANDLQAVSTYGSMDNAVKAGYKPEGMSLPNMGSFSVQPAPTTPVQNALAVKAPGMVNAAPQIPSVNNTPIVSSNLPAPPPPVAALTQDATIPPIPPAPTKFSPPAQLPGESIAAYTARSQREFEAYKSDPNYIAAQANATKKGGLEAEDTEKAKQAAQLTQRLQQNLLAMKAINDQVPSAGFLPSSASAYVSQVEGAHPRLNAIVGGDNGARASAANQWDQINNQQVVSEIQQFLSAGGAGARINQTLDKIMRSASAVNREDLPASRAKQIDNALAEISNKNVSAQNIAGDNQPYQPIPAGTSQPPATNGIKFLGFQ